MVRITKENVEALKWLRYILDPINEMPTISNWPGFLNFIEKQALTGVCLPEQCPANLSRDLLLQWIGNVQRIESQNVLLNNRIKQLFEKLEKDGFRCCLLKGQGCAEMYPNPLRRRSGDIDVWVDSDEKTVYEYVRNMFPEAEVGFKHIHFPIFDDAPVDVHVSPLKLYYSVYQKRLQRWIEQNKPEQFVNNIIFSKTNTEICVPTYKFNSVYQLGHMLIHFFDEGVGLRQVVDYYYVLKNLEVSQKEREELVETIKSLGMLRFAQAMMWIERDVLGLFWEYCIVKPDKRQGQRLLNDILEGGNFGHYSQRYKGRNGFYYRGIVETWRVITFFSMAPRESLSRVKSRFLTAIKHSLLLLKIRNK